jgi:signal transduction histidine kinase
MEQKELTGFIILSNVLLLVFIIGILLFIFQYRKRKMLHNQEKKILEDDHRQKLLQSQISIQQETMQFIGSEIHDSVSQKLTLASLYTSRIEYKNQFPEFTAQLQGVGRIINDSLEELRNLSRNLTDRNLQLAGLTEILRIECERVNETGICTATLDAPETLPEIPIPIKSLVQRVVQEFIQNSLKHSGAKNIFINVQFDDIAVGLDLSDDGKGFDPSAVHSQGIGLTNMRRRIEKTGARYALESSAGNGTWLHLSIPREIFNSGTII